MKGQETYLPLVGELD